MQRGFTGIFLLIWLLGLLVIFAGFYIYIKDNRTVNQTPEVVLLPTPTPSPWKVYTNDKYGLQIRYPLLGVIHEKDRYIEGECGQVLKEQKNEIILDNLFKIKIVGWQGTIAEYLTVLGAKNQYDLELLDNAGAEEAVKVIGLKKGAEYAVGYPPLVYVQAIYKKNGNIFIVKSIPFHQTLGGCIDPAVMDPVKYAKFQDQEWKTINNLKFVDLAE
ncbi:MAG: hypothetical protein C4584_00940 [Armatimonadetes bacterium]|nr:MAG: hypothetical protein C4584_00940 [Armatimonadota bacterium]